ncbi:MAG: MFS transporter [Thermomicrobiales bacterium]
MLDTTIAEPNIARRSGSLWWNRDFLIIWGGQTLSSAGSFISLLALPLLVLALTGSPARAGLIGALRGAAGMLVMLPAGALIDRWNRKWAMVVCDAGRLLAVGSLALALGLGHLSFIHICIVAVVEGVLGSFFELAYSALLPHVVTKEQLPAAVSRTRLSDSIMQVVGPSLGGLLYSLGRAVPFLVDTVSYVISTVSLLFVGTSGQGERGEIASTGRLSSEIRAGLAWLWQHSLLRFLAVQTGVMILCCQGYTLVVIVVAQSLGATPGQIGLIFAIEGIGSVIGAVLTEPVLRRFRFGPVVIWTYWIMVLTWLLYGIAWNLPVLAVLVALGYLVVPIYFGAIYSYRLASIPNELQGRVNSVYRLISFGGGPISLAATGWLLEAIGPFWTVIVTFVPQFILAVATLAQRSVREAGKL